MKTRFTYNFIEKAIIGSKAAIDRANKGKNPEYAELSGMLAAHPDFKVREKDIQKKEGKKTYSNLTIKKMEDYIRTQFADEKTLDTKLIEFAAIQKVAEVKGAKYPLTKKWFLATYPSFKKNEVSEQERIEKEKELAEEALADAEAQLDALEDETELDEETEEIGGEEEAETIDDVA